MGNELYMCFSDQEGSGLSCFLSAWCNWMVGLLLRHIYYFVDLMKKEKYIFFVLHFHFFLIFVIQAPTIVWLIIFYKF